IVKQVGRRWIRITDTRAADGGVVSLRTDVSSLKDAGEELRRAKEAAESANQAKSDFLANMSHEIRTPMNGIMGMTRLALDTELQPDQRRYINLVKVSADNLLAIIDDILDFSKIDAGKMEVDDEDFSLVETLEPMLRTLAVRAHEKKLQLGVVIGPEVPDGLRGDAGRLRQILNNLIGNALKFTEHGEVTLRVKVAQATGRELTLSFAVTDTGIGIPLDKQKLVFDAFSQADASTTRKYGGTGLGLTISSRLVALMGGSISLESGPGRGSCFRFTVKVGLARRAPRRKVAPIELRGKRVLVVDDNATNREAFRGMLTRWGLDVTASADGEAGLNELERAAAEGVPYQLAIIDGCMQEPDGPALIALVRGRAALDNVRMVLATSDVMPKKAGLPADVVAISKPAIGDELLEAILRALGGERPTPAQQVVAMAPKAPAGPRLRILVAEDNEVNQEIIRRRLEHQGHEVRLVDNGHEAAALIANETWDLVLMDVQMPSMGGFEATRLVREREAGGQRRTAIVALTAHAMKGDKERCLAAGMDGYLTKPLNWSTVNATIARFAQGQPQVTAAKSDATEACGPIDHERALQTVDGDRKLLSKVAGMFAKKLPRLLDSLRKAEETRDCAGLHANAHALVGAARNLGATSLAEAAGELETAAISCRWTEAEPMLVRVAEEVGRAIPELLQMTG
ncbi:MAG: response regulator, partial [Deltaproteobacteria bacterium]|nr:response regulator [Deltaproteobacteria bacterium]